MTTDTKLPPTYVEGFHDVDAVGKMKYSQLGATDMVVSQLSLGSGAFGNLYESDMTVEKGVDITVAALKAGVNIIDSAYWYGQGQAEKVLGAAFKQIPRNAFYMCTKVGRYEKDYPNMFNFTAERALSSVNESLERLGLEYIDLIQVHDVEFAANEEIIIKETLPALESLRRAGKVRYIGITGYALDVLKYTVFNSSVRGIIDKSTVKVDTVLSYTRGTMFDNSIEDFIPYFKSKHIGIINASPVGMALLTPQGPQDWHPASDELKQACRNLAQYCKENNLNISAMAVQYSASIPGVATTLIGVGSMEILNATLKTFTEPPTKEKLDTINKLRLRYFGNCKNHWEGFEIERYWAAIGGKPKP